MKRCTSETSWYEERNARRRQRRCTIVLRDHATNKKSLIAQQAVCFDSEWAEPALCCQVSVFRRHSQGSQFGFSACLTSSCVQKGHSYGTTSDRVASGCISTPAVWPSCVNTASTCAPQRYWCATQRLSPRCMPTAILTDSSSSFKTTSRNWEDKQSVAAVTGRGGQERSTLKLSLLYYHPQLDCRHRHHFHH